MQMSHARVFGDAWGCQRTGVDWADAIVTSRADQIGRAPACDVDFVRGGERGRELPRVGPAVVRDHRVAGAASGRKVGRDAGGKSVTESVTEVKGGAGGCVRWFVGY